MAKKTTSTILRPGLALSGGGFRATLFHLGALWRLNELGLLGQFKRITSVSGGSIISAYLGLKWEDLKFKNGVATNFKETLEQPIRGICNKNIDIGSIVLGKLAFNHPELFVKACYRQNLYGKATLKNLPTPSKGPRFIIYATNIQSGVSFWFSRKEIGDYRIGYQKNQDISLATAVAASSAFPPFLSPLILKSGPEKWKKPSFGNGFGDLFDSPEFHQKMYLSDGGVYDNMGIEAVWKAYNPIFASAAGSPMATPENPWLQKLSWSLHAKRVLDISIEQNRRLRRRILIEKYIKGEKAGAYWNISSRVENYIRDGRKRGHEIKDPLIKDSDTTAALKKLGTQLRPFKPKKVGHLMNWGYALADTAIRTYYLKGQKQGDWAWPDPKFPL